MINSYCRDPDQGRVTTITVITRENMVIILTCGSIAVMAAATAGGDITVIKNCRQPGR